MPRNVALNERKHDSLNCPKRDHDIAFLVAFINVAMCGNHLLESVAPVDDGQEFS